ncbi:reverse transcriptase [Senna tora]|uniref:Reverse transcriptase n=1 Tax=Senna tora TaxID=362788 RepID=A0A834W2I5_9FABA|nr:reverse transcriptase [Senna tora]
MDGSFWTHSNMVSCGGVFRDSNGKWLKGFTRKVGIGDSLLAEAWVIKTRLDIAWGLGLKKIVIEADSLSIINMIEKGLDDYHPLFPIIIDIRGIVASDWEVELVHSLRKSNRIANALANWTDTSLVGIEIHRVPPRCCSSILYDDAKGLCLLVGFLVSFG